MAVTTHTRLVLSHALKSRDLADEFADVIDAGSGTLSQACRDRFTVLIANFVAADGICDAADAGSHALTDYEKSYLARMLCSRVAANDIADEVAP